MKKMLLLLLLTACTSAGFCQTVKVISSGTKTSMRGLSVVDDKIVWVSGSNGTVGKSIDGGETWKWMIVKGFEKNDFRDIEAFDGMTAVIMGIADPAYILRTIDGGENWQVVFENKEKGMFLDAMEFWNEQSGIVIGDPLKGHFFIARTFDGGQTWQAVPDKNLPVADSGEACFASSGTNVRKLNKSEAVFITGGLQSNVFLRDKKIKLPVIQGTESTGANSIAVKNSKTFMVVGGDFNTKDSAKLNCFYTKDAGKSWTAPQQGPHGYRSCVEWLGKNKWISCGLNGVDYSPDGGRNFTWISKESFHVVRQAKKGKAVYFAGGGGRIGKLVPAN
ncbi:MAG: oxidoreductase [Ferruginibacter sp.]|nr:oxidoreductase [Ferruginibacter sp.]